MKRVVLAAVAALITGLGTAPALAASAVPPPSATAAANAVDAASIVRGGRLYDNWSRESKERLPNHPNPAFKTKQVRVAAPDTWRCSECHGWDYKGNHGVVGIRGKRNGDPAAIAAVLKDATHNLAEYLHESDRQDLANFVAYGQVDMQGLVESARRAKTAVTTTGKLFATACASCHGHDGSTLREVPPLGDGARQRPHEILHVVVNGHPGGRMPALRTLGEETAAKMLAYLQTLPSVNLVASIVNGGRLYDDWQVHSGGPGQALPHPAYPPKAYYANAPAMTWRCKECHGWDYKGNQGEYGGGIHATGIKGIRAMAGAEPEQIMSILRNSTHLYGAVLKYRDLLDLANFVSQGQLDMDSAIDPRSRLSRGDAARGAAHYRTICAGCHGFDGHFTAKRTLSREARANPWESLHKILNGHPDEAMPALREIDRKVIADILAHIQGLPDRH
ncbi:MAG: c-type cytochrome [Sulfuritalea sp.]|nr:c-type cytochrome [Sulfuritalea sp.]MDP1983257.1 c-type cytochrome [Sulfuritalea sp.]